MTSPTDSRGSLRRLGAALLASFGLAALPALAQTYPNRPVTIIWPFAAGSAVDGAVRAFASAVSKRLNQQFVVDNRAGANGMIGLTAMQQANPNGHVIMFTTNGMMVQLPLISRKYTHAPGRDYAPISVLFAQQMVLGAHPGVPFRDLRGLIDYAKRNPGTLNVATSGTLATTTLATELVISKAGIKLTNVPYKGVAQATPDLLANRVQLQMMGAQLKQMVDAGKLIAIAVTGQKRWGMFPGVPTLAESGLPGVYTDIWFPALAPARTPPAVLATLNAAFNAALTAPEVKGALEAMSSDPLGTTAEEAVARIRAEQEVWLPIVREANLKADDE